MKAGFVLWAFVALPLAAQQPRTGHDEHAKSAMMSHMEEMMAPIMGAMAYKPDQLLARRDSLNLTAQQITRLTALQDAAKRAHEQCGAEAKPHLDAIVQGLRASADTAALKLHVEAAHAAMGKSHWAMFTVAHQARALLTDEQRARVDRWTSRKTEHGAQHH